MLWLEMTSGDLETTSQFGTWKRLPSLALGNDFPVWHLEMTSQFGTQKQLPCLALGNDFPVGHSEMTSQFGTLKRILENKCGMGELQRLWQLLEAAAGCQRGPHYDRKCSFYYYFYFSVQLQQTETSERKLCIFQPGLLEGIKHKISKNWLPRSSVGIKTSQN